MHRYMLLHTVSYYGMPFHSMGYAARLRIQWDEWHPSTEDEDAVTRIFFLSLTLTGRGKTLASTGYATGCHGIPRNAAGCRSITCRIMSSMGASSYTATLAPSSFSKVLCECHANPNQIPKNLIVFYLSQILDFPKYTLVYQKNICNNSCKYTPLKQPNYMECIFFSFVNKFNIST